MVQQPRQRSGTRRGSEPVGGRWVSKTVPDIDTDLDGFNNTTHPAVGPVNDWDTCIASVGRSVATFKRSVETDSDGTDVTTITTDCEDPAMVLLARKGDASYWSGNRWTKDHKTRRTWTGDIAVNMLREGLIATHDEPDDLGLRTAMNAAASPHRQAAEGVHGLTRVVAQLRGLRVVLSTAPSTGWTTKLGGYKIPSQTNQLLTDRFMDVYKTYETLPQPPWDTAPPSVPWGSQTVAGHATNHAGDEVFVGENSDLMWRALTETTSDGLSPLKQGLKVVDPGQFYEMICAAALYDGTANRQLTTDLFVGVAKQDRSVLHEHALLAFTTQLNPTDGSCRWSVEQQHQIGDIVTVLEGMEP